MNRKKGQKIRLDQLLVKNGLVSSRNKAQSLIGAGQVFINGKVADKAGHYYDKHTKVIIKKNDFPFVSRAGLKLAHALSVFGFDVGGLECMDVGASTGGFTHCLLENGAQRVTAVDVGYGQLDWQLRNDPRVRVLERTNIRYLENDKVNCKFHLITIDTSFISLRLVVPAVLRHLRHDGHIIALVKPQFEAGKKRVGKGGIVKDKKTHGDVLNGLCLYFVTELNLQVINLVASPIKGAKGNIEFLIWLTPFYKS